MRAAAWCSPWARLEWRKTGGSSSAYGSELRQTSIVTSRGKGDFGQETTGTGRENGGEAGEGGEPLAEQIGEGGVWPVYRCRWRRSSARPELGSEKRERGKGKGMAPGRRGEPARSGHNPRGGGTPASARRPPPPHLARGRSRTQTRRCLCSYELQRHGQQARREARRKRNRLPSAPAPTWTSTPWPRCKLASGQRATP